MAAAFGLRVEEALKFQPRRADKGDRIALAPSWTKGGRAREIPVHSRRHRALLDEVHAEAGDSSLIPDHKTYITHRKAFEHQTLKAGLTNLPRATPQLRTSPLQGADRAAVPQGGGHTPKSALRRSEGV